VEDTEKSRFLAVTMMTESARFTPFCLHSLDELGNGNKAKAISLGMFTARGRKGEI
jgi:hypothetical protein